MGAALAALLVLLINGAEMNMAFFNENPHMFIYIEVTAVGLFGGDGCAAGNGRCRATIQLAASHPLVVN